MGKYRTSPQKSACGDSVAGLLFWGVVFFVTPPLAAGALSLGNLETYLPAEPFLSAEEYGQLPQNCTPSALNDFPADFFTKEQRLNGWLVVHFLISFYAFYALFLVCDDYFVPSIEAITKDLGISTDLAGATFMAISTSAPELFTNVIGTFVTKGDLGVGTIVGSAIFNILAVGFCCGIGAGYAVQTHHRKLRRPGIVLDWWPLTRDCLFYLVSVGLLLLVLENRRIYWYEALTLLLFYFVYILVMCNNALFKSWAERILACCNCTASKEGKKIPVIAEKEEKSPLISDALKVKTYDGSQIISRDFTEPWEPESSIGSREGTSSPESSTEEEEELLNRTLLRCESRAQEEKEAWGLCSFPIGSGCGGWLAWLTSWPMRFLLTFTIPDCREHKWRRWYVITLLMCVIWIAGMTYIVSWMMEIIGDTIDIPESVTGLTFLAAGTSIPEVISSVIVVRQGFGSMGLSNSIGSNTFDLLFCLGLPWLVQSVVLVGTDVPYVEIHSGGIEYSVGLLVTSLLLFYAAVAFNGFILDWRVGVACLLMYATFIPLACLLELNFFFPVNLPTCVT